MRRAVLASLLALSAWPAAAAAQTPPPAELLPAPAAESAPARIARGGDLALAIRSSAPAGSVVIRVSGTPHTDDRGLLRGPKGTWADHPAEPTPDPGLHVWRPSADSIARRRPGTYWWQAYLTGPAADTAEDPVGPVERFEVLQPAARRGKGRLHPSYGRSVGGAFYLSSAGFPEGVSGSRFRTLIRGAAARWGLRARRWTSARAGRLDGFDIAGFGRNVPSFALAMQVDYVKRSTGQIVERDLVIRAGIDWHAGPGYPALDQFDLESVLLHELSHFAGNKRHRGRCANSPLVAALGPGEWWRGPRDRWIFGCASTAATAALAHRTVEIE